MKSKFILLITILGIGLVSCSKEDITDYQNSVTIILKKDKEVKLSPDGWIWFINNQSSPGVKIKETRIPDSEKTIHFPKQNHNNRFTMYVSNDRTGRVSENELDFSKSRELVYYIYLYKNGNIEVVFKN